MIMTEKELLYIDDALSHLEQIHEFCMTYETDVEDDDLKKEMREVMKKTSEIHNKFIKLLEE